VGLPGIGVRSRIAHVLYDAGRFGGYVSMKSRETLIRLKKFQVDEKRRKVAFAQIVTARHGRRNAHASKIPAFSSLGLFRSMTK
jgi:hypothetical protein